MKKTLLLSAALGLGAFVLSSAANASTVPGTGIVGSYHDLSGNVTPVFAGVTGGGNPDDSLNRVCIYCHAPHHTYKPGVGEYKPLWNRPDSLYTQFAMYSNGANNWGAAGSDHVDA